MGEGTSDLVGAGGMAGVGEGGREIISVCHPSTCLPRFIKALSLGISRATEQLATKRLSVVLPVVRL